MRSLSSRVDKEKWLLFPKPFVLYGSAVHLLLDVFLFHWKSIGHLGVAQMCHVTLLKCAVITGVNLFESMSVEITSMSNGCNIFFYMECLQFHDYALLGLILTVKLLCCFPLYLT